jgi:outer membrane protein assembly factor BamE (lipoprotein component of BamABCDE complex)
MPDASRTIGRRARKLLAIAGALAMGLGACQPRIDTRGNLPDPDNVLKINPGIDGRDQVATLLGSPSSIATFDDDTWYYISRRTETLAFFEPEVVDQEVLMVKFDETGIVSDMKIYGLEDGQPIQPVERTTPTLGREMTILQQLIGNLGRFNKDTSGAPTAAPGTLPPI